MSRGFDPDSFRATERHLGGGLKPKTLWSRQETESSFPTEPPALVPPALLGKLVILKVNL
jgi:hypothetical protein